MLIHADTASASVPPPVLNFPPLLSFPTLRVKFTQLTAVLRNVWKLIPGVDTSLCVCAT